MTGELVRQDAAAPPVSPDAVLEGLSAAERQLFELSRAGHTGASTGELRPALGGGRRRVTREAVVIPMRGNPEQPA